MKSQVQENGPLVFESLVSLIPSDLVEFTDEEGYGRYLDLHDCYLKYINLKASEVRPRRGESGSDSRGVRTLGWAPRHTAVGVFLVFRNC